MTPDEEDLLAGIVQLLMSGVNGLWWIGDPDGDIEFEPASESTDER